MSDSVQALNSTIYNISTGNKETALFKVCDYGSNINHILHIYSSPNGTLDSCNYIRVILSDKYIFVNKYLNKPLYFSRYRDFFQIWYTDFICHVFEIEEIRVLWKNLNLGSCPSPLSNGELDVDLVVFSAVPTSMRI